MTAQELKMAAWEMDATASALAVNMQRMAKGEWSSLDEWDGTQAAINREIASLQAYAHALQAEAAKEGAA